MLTGQQEKALEQLKGLEDVIKSQIGAAFAKALGAAITKIGDDIGQALDKFAKAIESSDALVRKIENQGALVKSGIDEFTQQTAGLKGATDSLMSSIEMTVNNSLGASDKNIEEVLQIQRDLVDSIKALRTLANQL